MEYIIGGGAILLVVVIAIVIAVKSRRSPKSDPATVFGGSAAAVTQPRPAAEEEAEQDDEDTQTAEQLLVEADELYAQREYGDALDKYGEALTAAIEDKGHDDLLVANILEKQGDADLAVNGDDYDSDTIPTEYLRALSVRERVHGPFYPDLLPVLRKIIGFYDRFGDHHEADGLIRRHRDIEEAVERAKREKPPAGV